MIAKFEIFSPHKNEAFLLLSSSIVSENFPPKHEFAILFICMPVNNIIMLYPSVAIRYE